MQAAVDFKAECDAIHALVAPLSEAQLAQTTLFKDWTINDIMAHLHLWNIAANDSLCAPDKFQDFVKDAMGQLGQGVGHIELQNGFLDGLSGTALIRSWKDYYDPMAERFASADPDKRVKWAGPDMSVRSCIIARQMEHWAHAQAIYDVLGQTRENADRLKNVAHIGVTTYRWSHLVNRQEAPQPKPYVKLTAPSGAIWTWNEPQDDNYVEGLATEFCQVVTQCRNIDDTSLITRGAAATNWMTIAQCFAGGAETPPVKGQRHKGA